jgi:ABC-type transport system involved in multi-copper enzyme maturation permease subunit
MKPSTWTVARAIGWVTFREILRDKILYNALLVAILVFGAALLASRLTFSRPDRVVLDFGVSAVNLATSAMAILLGAGVLVREIERRTILVALSRPVSHTQFLLGKFAGLALLILVNWAILALVFGAIYVYTSPPGTPMGLSLVAALGLSLLQAWLLGALALFFSTLSTTGLSVTIGAGIYLIGNNVSQLRFLAEKDPGSAFAAFLRVASRVIPNLEHFNVGFKATYALPVPASFVGVAVGYAALWIMIAIVGGGLLLRRREL